MKTSDQLTRFILAVAVNILLISGVFARLSYGQESQQAGAQPGNPLVRPSKIIVADDNSYAPFAFLDLEGRPSGISIEIWKLWSRKTGIPVEFQLMEWDAALMAVRQGEADVVGGLFLTPQRQEFFDFTKPYFNIATSIFFNEQLHGIRGIGDLGGFTVGVIKGDSAEELIQKDYPGIRTASYPNAERLAQAARSGEIKVFIADSDVGRFYLTKIGEWGQFREAATPMAENKQYAAVRKGNQKLLAVLQHGLDLISHTEIHTIVEAYTGVPLASRLPWPAILSALGSVAALLCLMFFWNLQLKRRVADATNHLKQRNEDLQRSESNYREMFNATSDMIFIHDPVDGRILDMNRAAQEVTGYSREDLFGKSVGIISAGAPPHDEETALRWIHEAVSKGAAVAEWFFRKRDGENFWAEVALRCTLIHGETRVLALIRDITDRKRVEESLRQSERRLAMAISATADAIWEWNLDTQETYYSRRWYEMLGYSDREFPMTFDTWKALCHPDDLEPVYQHIQKTLEFVDSDGYVAEFRMKAKDGSWVWILGRGNVTERNASGEPRLLSGTNTDITRRKEIENQLREREDFARRILNSVDAQLAVIDINGQIQDVNDAWRSLALKHGGGDESKWGVGANYVTVCENALAATTRARDAMEGLRQVQQGLSDYFEMEYSCDLPEVVYWFTMRIVPLIGQPGTVLVSHTDITDRKVAQESIIRTEQRLQRQSEAIHALMQDNDLFDGDFNLAISKITEVMAEATYTERVSVWLYEEGHQRIRCMDLYERSQRRHSEGQCLISADFPSYVSTHQQGNVIAVEDVFEDSRTIEIPEDYFRSNNIVSLLDAPIWIEDGIRGILCFEQVGETRTWAPEEERLAGTVAMLIALCHAISAQLKTEERLRESEQRFRNIIDTSFDGIIIHDAGRIIDINENPLRYLGYERNEVIGSNLLDFFAPGYVKDAAENLRSVIENPAVESGRLETRIVGRSGKEYDVEYFSRATQYHGKYVRVVAFRDITERKEAERTLRESEFRFRTFYNSNPEGVLLMGLNGEILDLNRALIRKSGYQPQEVVNRHFSEFVPAEYHQLAEKSILSIKSGILQDKLPELAYIKKDGTIFPISINGWIVTDEESHPLLIGVFIHDLSQEKKLIEEKEVLMSQLIQSQKMEAIGTLAGGIAHDFNNILGAIIGYTELTLLEEPTDQKTKRATYLNRVLDAGKRAKDLVQQILRFSRRDETTMQILSISPLLKETTRLLRSTLPKTIQIEQRIQVEDDTIYGDSTQIHQIIMNLCTNAYHAMRDTGGVLTLTLEKGRLLTPREFLSLKVPPGEYVKLSVSDTGQGIDPQTIQRVFEPYFTTKPLNEGTGLGLSVTLGIVRGHGGLIDLQSKVGEGTRFDVYFPLAHAESAETVKSESRLPLGNMERILIVDDELLFLDVLRESLNLLGYRVTTHQSSLKALEAFKHNPDQFDILVTDQSMPEMTGVQLVAEVRKFNKDIPIILCTGFSETVSEESAAHYGISKFIMKPVSTSDLARAVHEAILLRGAAGAGLSR